MPELQIVNFQVRNGLMIWTFNNPESKVTYMKWYGRNFQTPSETKENKLREV